MRKTFKPANVTIALSVIAALAGALSALNGVDQLEPLWQDDAPPSASAQRADSGALELRSGSRESGGYAPDPQYAADTPASAATSPPIPMAQQASQYLPVAAVDGDQADASNSGSADAPPEAIFMTSEEAIEQERIQQETLSQRTESDSTDMSSPTAEEEAALKELEENLRIAAAAAEATVESGAGNNAAADAESN
jgi:hypothetical protein